MRYSALQPGVLGKPFAEVDSDEASEGRLRAGDVGAWLLTRFTKPVLFAPALARVSARFAGEAHAVDTGALAESAGAEAIGAVGRGTTGLARLAARAAGLVFARRAVRAEVTRGNATARGAGVVVRRAAGFPGASIAGAAGLPGLAARQAGLQSPFAMQVGAGAG